MKTVLLQKVSVLCLTLLLVLFCGCGYRIGYTPHPQIRSLAVAPVSNETLAVNAAGKARKLLCERIMVDGTYKLVSQAKADAIIYLKITSVTYSEVSWVTEHKRTAKGGEDILYTPNQWSASITGEYAVVMPGRGTPIIKGTSSGSAEFEAGPDIELGRQTGLEQAAYEMTKNIVAAMADSW